MEDIQNRGKIGDSVVVEMFQHCGDDLLFQNFNVNNGLIYSPNYLSINDRHERCLYLNFNSSRYIKMTRIKECRKNHI